MMLLLRSGLEKSRFIALLTLGLSASVVTASPPILHTQVSPAVLVLHHYGDGKAQLDKARLMEAAPHSVHGKLYAYQCARRKLEESVAAQNEAYEAYMALLDLSRVEVIARFPAGDYHSNVAAAVGEYHSLQSQAAADFRATKYALMALAGERIMSDAEMMSLHHLLEL